MADINTRALRVISWLGEEKDESGDGVDFLHFLSLQNDPFSNRLGDWWLQNPNMVSGNPGAAIARFLSRTYWTRVWILQEASLSRPGSVVICGARKIHTRNLLQAMRIFKLLGQSVKKIWLRGKTYTDPEVRQLESGFWKMFCVKTLIMRSLDPADTDQPKLLESDLLTVLGTLHQNARNADCKDERDKVYGQLGLLDHRMSSLVNASYAKEKTFMQAMADLAIAVIKGTDSLDWVGLLS
ncbi:MAG: hypothetical protein LQ338_007408 [Usnochroma carphineum]|nr:MAG: hypothetical protein LQ338_007408 [Usnochroma carphineum]